MTDPLTARLSELLAKATPELLTCKPHRMAQMLRDGAAAQSPKPDNLHSHDFEADGAFIMSVLDALPALLAERAILIAEREEARALLEPFARHFDAFAWADKSGKPFSPETVIAKTSNTPPLLLQSFRAARAYLTRETSE